MQEAASQKKMISGLFVALLVFAAGAAAALAGREYLRHESTIEHKGAEIAGPSSIDHAGQYAVYRLNVPGLDSRALIYTWNVESLTPGTEIQDPSLVDAPLPNEIQFLTPAGDWRLCGSWADPVTRTGGMVTKIIHVPGAVEPPHSPLPLPDSRKPDPLPDRQPLPPPPPSSPFADFTTAVSAWRKEVQSPDVAIETAALAAGADALAERLKTGDLSKAAGMVLKTDVILAVRAANSKAVAKHASDWQGFAARVSTWVTSNSHRLTTAADWSALMTAFATGLRN